MHRPMVAAPSRVRDAVVGVGNVQPESMRQGGKQSMLTAARWASMVSRTRVRGMGRCGRHAIVIGVVRKRGSDQGAFESSEPVQDVVGDSPVSAVDGNNLVAVAEPLRVYPPRREIRPEVGCEPSYITGVWVHARSTEGRDNPFNSKEVEVAEALDSSHAAVPGRCTCITLALM